MIVLLVIVGALLAALVIVLVAVARIRPERLSLRLHPKHGMSLDVHRPRYAERWPPHGRDEEEP